VTTGLGVDVVTTAPGDLFNAMRSILAPGHKPSRRRRSFNSPPWEAHGPRAGRLLYTDLPAALDQVRQSAAYLTAHTS
jgi:hypothetical protein